MQNFTRNDILELLKKDMPAKALVEEAHALSIGDFGKKLIFSESGLDKLLFPDLVKETIRGKKGKFILRGTVGNLFINYEVKMEADDPFVDLFFVRDPTKMDGGSEQTIKLTAQELQYGTRYYFMCGCGRRCNKLYLPQNNLFACRICCDLTYESTRINKNTMGGLSFYVHRRIKLAKIREGMDRISYNSKPTKRASRFFRQWNELEEFINTDTKRLANQQFAEVLRSNSQN